ncbi:hypothetical protein NMG60_11023232 [Bertholletia excelsa]
MAISNSDTMTSSPEAPTFSAETQEYIDNIKEVLVHLDKVKKITTPGCSQEVLNVAVSSMSSLARVLSVMSSKAKPHSAL